MSSIYNNYFLSEKIKVFPCAYRNSTYDATARLNTEYNFTHLPHMVDKASYLIKFNDIPENETTTKLICVIQGYYFEIKLDAGDYTTLQNKYLNICVASPNGAGSIESPHLCSWESINIEDTLDITKGSNTFFAGLKISSGEALSKNTYQCYALKLDDSAKLPISANKIENIVKNSYGVENGTGKPISQEFTTGALDVKTGDTSILKAENTEEEGKKVTIEASTNITGTTTIKGTTEIKNSSGTATEFTIGEVQQQDVGEVLCADVEVPLFVKNSLYVRGQNLNIGNTSSVPDIKLYGIQPNPDNTSTFTNGTLLQIGKADGKIVVNGLIKASSDGEVGTVGEIFSIDPKTGETYARKINATVEGTSANADNAKNVTDTIKGTNITDIFESNGLVAKKASSLTASAGNIIVVGDTDDTTDALLPKNDTGRTYNIGSSTQVFDNIYAWTFHGNASTADSFSSATTVELTGNITGTSAVSTKGWTVYTTIADKAVTKNKIKDGEVTNAKLAGNIENGKLENSSIKIGSSNVALGGSIGTLDKPFIGDLYFGKQKSGNENDNCRCIITGQYYQKSSVEYPLTIRDYFGTNLVLFTNNYRTSADTSVPKQIIYAATSNDTTKGRTELFGDEIRVYAQGHDYTSGTIKAGTVDLSEDSSNEGLKISKIGQIKVGTKSLQSSSLVGIKSGKVYLGSTTYGAVIDSTSTDATFVINSAKTPGDILQINKLVISSGTTSTKVFGVDYEGNVTANTYNATSDRRLKENIIDYKPEKSILDLPVKKFDFIDGPKNQIGCIAQDLKEICPEIVNENEKGYLSIQENKLVYLLLDEVKKLKNEVDELKRK